MTPRTFHIDNRHKLHHVLSLLANLLIDPEKPLEIVVKPATRSRSVEQNKRYWAIVQEIADTPVQGKLYPSESWHEYLKGAILGFNEIELPNKKTIQQPISTTTLDTVEFSDYMEKVCAWAAQHGILISDDRIAA